jgi:ribonuclease BN (tRNA processing enzyme)
MRPVMMTLLLMVMGATQEAGAQAPGPLQASPTTQLVLLGTGTPNAEPDRWGSALAVVVNGTPYLVDAGAGIVRRATAAAAKGVQGLEAKRLGTLFLTHLHSDHTVGLPDLIYSPWTLEREEPLRVFGPKGTESMIHHILLAYQEDVDVRINGLEPANTGGASAEVVEISSGVVYEDENVKVTAFAVLHGGWEEAFGFRFETPDRTIVISGDTSPTDAVVEMCQGCDILVHEVYSQAGFDGRVPAWQKYHAASHTSGLELGRLAARAQPKVLVLTHQLLWGATPEELVAEIKSAFNGFVIYGKDLDVF